MGAYGWKPQAPDHRDRLYHMEEKVQRAFYLPGKVDLWESGNVPSIWDQGQLGSCTAHGSLRTYLTECKRQGLDVPMLSRLMQYFDSRKLEGTIATDSGATVRDAIKALATFGCAPESLWPYLTTHFATTPPQRVYDEAKKHLAIKYQLLVPNVGYAPIRTALASGLTVVFGFSVPERFEDGTWNPESEVLSLPTQGERIIGGHCVAITGYDFSAKAGEPFFICDNSWNTSWGGAWGAKNCTGGRFAMSWEWFAPWRGLATDLWVIQSDS